MKNLRGKKFCGVKNFQGGDELRWGLGPGDVRIGRAWPGRKLRFCPEPAGKPVHPIVKNRSAGRAREPSRTFHGPAYGVRLGRNCLIRFSMGTSIQKHKNTFYSTTRSPIKNLKRTSFNSDKSVLTKWHLYQHRIKIRFLPDVFEFLLFDFSM